MRTTTRLLTSVVATGACVLATMATMATMAAATGPAQADGHHQRHQHQNRHRDRTIPVQLLSFNDFHGNLEAPSGSGGANVTGHRIDPVTGKPVDVTTPAGGVAYLATLSGGGDGFAAFRGGTDKFFGGLDIDAFGDYLPAHSPYTPAAPTRITR